ncbi:MAG: hypothetical protein ACFFAO_07415, partial [Candidatus Hermodarchaeota archaeon]
MVTLSTLEVYQAIFTMIFVVIAILLGIRICLRYFEYKRRELYLAGLTIILMVAPYIYPVIDFFWIISYNDSAPVEIIYLGIGFVAIANLTWLTLITDLLYKQKQKIILIIIAAQLIAFEIFLIYAILVQPTLILIPYGGHLYREAPILIFYYLFSIVLFLTAGFMFVRGSLKSENKETRLKGKIICIALISYVVGAVLDFAIEPTIFSETLARLVQISAF